MKTVSKPWGEEVWFAYDNGNYVGKILRIKAGHRLSLQYHKVKKETLYLDEGLMKLTLEEENGHLQELTIHPGQSREILPGRRHRMEAVENCKVFEVSTPEVEDVVRVEDDYGRAEDKSGSQ